VTQFVLILSAGLREPEAGRGSRISIPSPNSSHCRRPVFDKAHLAQQSLALSISNWRNADQIAVTPVFAD
jgi:hypothetical protein